MASVATVASAPPVPSALKRTVPKRRAPSSRRQAEQAVDGDHHRREHRLAGQGRRLVTSGQHERHDERDLDDRDRDREHERAEGLPDPEGDDLGVVHGRQHGPGEQQGDEHHDDEADVPAPRGDERDEGDDRARPSRAGSSSDWR